MPVLVHPRFGEVELGFFVLLVASEFLADLVASGVFCVCGAVPDIGLQFFAVGHKVAAASHLAYFVGYYSRTAEVVGRGVVYVPSRGRCGG